MTTRKISLEGIAMKLAILLFIPVALFGQVQPAAFLQQAPVVVQAKQHRFWDKAGTALQSLAIGSKVFDVAETERAKRIPGKYEMNPMLRSNAALVGVKLAGVGVELGIAAALHATGHHKAERWVPVLFAGPSLAAGIHNAGVK